MVIFNSYVKLPGRVNHPFPPFFPDPHLAAYVARSGGLDLSQLLKHEPEKTGDGDQGINGMIFISIITITITTIVIINRIIMIIMIIMGSSIVIIQH